MTSTSDRRIKAFRAGGVIGANKFVKLDPNDDNSVLLCGQNERAIGVSQTAALAEGEQIEVAMQGGGAKLESSGTIAKGKLLTSNASGEAEIADAAGEWCGAIAMEDSVDGDVFWVEVIQCQAQADDS